MIQFNISKPHPDEFVNRKTISCPICHKQFMAMAEGVILDIASDDGTDPWRRHIDMDKYLPYGYRYMCSEECANFYILTVI